MKKAIVNTIGLLSIAAFAIGTTGAAFGDEYSDREAALALGGAWHYKSFSCVDTKVTSVGERLEDGVTHKPIPDTGSAAAYATTLGLTGLKGLNGKPLYAGIVRYDDNHVMVAEKVGDSVQVCHIGTPIPMGACKNPDLDTRGREYRVYDYKLHAAYSGFNAEHLCGGA